VPNTLIEFQEVAHLIKKLSISEKTDVSIIAHLSTPKSTIQYLSLISSTKNPKHPKNPKAGGSNSELLLFYIELPFPCVKDGKRMLSYTINFQGCVHDRHPCHKVISTT
jgi:hypothetical protein